jgi:hypothetical protein
MNKLTSQRQTAGSAKSVTTRRKTSVAASIIWCLSPQLIVRIRTMLRARPKPVKRLRK